MVRMRWFLIGLNVFAAFTMLVQGAWLTMTVNVLAAIWMLSLDYADTPQLTPPADGLADPDGDDIAWHERECTDCGATNTIDEARPAASCWRCGETFAGE